MLTLTTLSDAITKLETAANAADKNHDNYLNARFWQQRDALNMAATFLRPQNPDEAIFLHGLLEEFVEFVDDEPTRESDRHDATDAILRLNESLRDYAIGA